MRKSSVQSALGAALLLVVAGCGSSESGGGSPAASSSSASDVFAKLAEQPYDQRLSTMEEQAAKEGGVTLYSSRDADLLEKLKGKFEELYPDVPVQYLSGENPELFARIQQEGAGDNAAVDVVMADVVPAMIKEGLAAHLHGAMIPEDYPKDGFGDQYISFGPDPSVIAWNTNLVSSDDAPKSWDDLLDPKWKGKIAIEAKPDHVITAMVLKWGEDKTRDYLKKFMANEPTVRKGHSSITELLAAGEFPIASEQYLHDIDGAIADGAPLDWAAPDPTGNGANAFTLAENAPHPNAAALFAHFLIDKPGAEILAADGRLVLTPGVKALYPDAEELVGDPRITVVDPVTREEANTTALDLVKEFITPAFTG